MAKATPATAKVDFGQIFMIVAVVQQFVSEVRATVKGTHAEKQAAIITAVRNFLPLVETVTGKDLLDNEKFNTAITAIVAAFLKSPDSTTAKKKTARRR